MTIGLNQKQGKMVCERVYTKRNRKKTGGVGRACDFCNDDNEISTAKPY